ncbi:interferon-induced very large GTPase 1-like isoform X2 [Acanthochromis polyacanthus]|uniref:interferon-induced very large GTPase 1-like isoform X2 n=1 Tax=Acanthochromis polyacanthus TaxID=80966 RepID=UPI0022346492|nr:interferon-induced very large GTPase 1-like isoform X2 [Acanthochromis polyacanthus]
MMMMMENPDSNSETKSVIPCVQDDLEEREAITKVNYESVSEPEELQHQEQNNGSKEQQSEDTSATSDTGISELTLVLIGDTNSIEFGPNNILLDHDNQTNVEQLSSKVYDLCGRYISVINLLGVQSKDQIPVNQRIHAFVLLLPNGLHNSHYSSGVQWLEKAFGRESLAHLIPVVTHQTGETCESALNDLKANHSFDERRYHTCRRSMTDGKEILDLLQKVDVMVSGNDPHWYREVIRRENKEHQEHKEEKTEPSVIQQNQTGEADKEKKFISENSWNMNERSMEQGDTVENTSPTSQTVSSDTTERHDQEGSTATTEAKSVPVNECKDAEPSEKSNNSVITKKKGTSDEDLCRNKEKQEKVSEKINRKNQHQRETEALFGRLHLQDQQQQKWSSSDFLELGSSMKQQHEVSEKDLPHAFLHRLMMLDYRARYIPVRPDSSKVVHPKLDPVFNTTEADDSVLEAFLSIDTDKHQTKATHVHPMDVQMAVFHCSDNFLKQIMITKLSQCQYALPLLVPDPFTMEIECPLWIFRHITKTWKVKLKPQIKDDSNIVTMKSIPICKAETPLVSFFRLGSLSVSKSQLMNTLINDRHSTFFHRHCPGSTKSRHLMDGVAEIAWYCPAGKANDAFSDCIAFCNLHGDALSIEKQRDILLEKSSVNVVLVPTLQKGDKSQSLISALFKSQKPLICLFVDDSFDAVEMIKGKYKMGLKDKSHSDVSEELKRIIGEVLSSPDPSSLKPTFQLETMDEVSGIRVDESDPVCQRGKSAAMEIVSLLEGMEVSKIKDKFLPCQGRLWHEWCRTNKELYHLKGDIEKERSKKLRHLDQIRQRQCDASCSKLMELFTKSLMSLPSTEKEYFLKWIQILVDALSTDDLSSILQNYDKMWSEVLALKNKHDKSHLLARKQTELEDISKKLQSATFGLEHIFREMGQIYEAHKTMKSESSRTDWSKYPELAADLMISGHPMELMDGDAGHVPLIWISSLLDEVIKKLGDQRVFVLSVLGVQSSGKSTMLNAMFGLQFAVSAGRCTKGAFMQLVKVSEEVKKEKDFRFDYILVVDTEGLRALELAGNTSLHHDNELATFVVGLGNMTIINIFGENPADMQDILQIVVQAFMRMKEVKLSPSCVFVHQNVTDIAATEKNMDGKRRLQEKLDQMTELAAKEETSNAECFNDVIAFDVQKDVKYAAQLWEGSPPMAPPNPGYSESIQEVKNIILSKASVSAGIPLSQLKTKIQDLWNALLNENFVFSFRNTLEIAVYRKLEVQYGNWTWTLRSNMLTIEDQLYTRIENGKLDKIEQSYLLKETSKTYEDIKTAMKAHFEDDENKETLVQWQGRFESKIKEFHDEQVRGVKRKLDGVIEQKKACKKMDDKKTEFENKLLKKSKELAQQLQDKVHDEEELEKQFGSVWDGWVHELTADAKPVEDINLEDEQLAVLLELGIEFGDVEESKTSGGYKHMSELGDYSDYVNFPKNQSLYETSEHGKDSKTESKDTNTQGRSFLRSVFKTVQKHLGLGSTTQQKQQQKSRSLLSCKEEEQIRELINNVEKESLDEIQSKPVATRGYVSTYLQEVAKNVKEEVKTFQSTYKYTLKNEFTVDLLLYVFDRMESWLLESQKTFKENNDALAYLDSKKMQYYSIFRSFCKGSSSAVVLGELICENLRDSAADAVYNRTAIGLADEMRCNFPAFNGNRLNFEKHQLKSLAENEDFNGFIKYIRDPRAQAETFIKKKVEKYIFRDHKDKAMNILKKNVGDINTLVSEALSAATQKVQTQRGDTNMWLSEFTGCLSNVLKFEAISSQNFSDINDFEFLQEEVKKGLKPIIEEMKELSLYKIKKSRNKPDKILIDQLCKCCWVNCPFCAAVCTNTIENHSPDDHSVPFHRPSGIKGWHYKDTVEMSINFCTTDVASNGRFYPYHNSKTSIPYKQYRLGGPEYAQWCITADDSKLPYWKWFVCRFQKQLEDYYNKEFKGRGAIPAEWRSITKDQAIESLDEMR